MKSARIPSRGRMPAFSRSQSSGELDFQPSRGEQSMSTNPNDRLTSCTDQAPEADSSGVSRRKFLGGLGGAAAAAMTAGGLGAALAPAPAAAAAGIDLDLTAEAGGTGGPGRLRRNASWQLRKN